MRGDNAGRKKKITRLAVTKIKIAIDEVANTPNLKFNWENVRAAINEKVFPEAPITHVTLANHSEIKAYYEERKDQIKNTAKTAVTYKKSSKAQVVEKVAQLQEKIRVLELQLRQERLKRYDDIRLVMTRPNDARFAEAIRRVLHEASS